MVKKRKTRDRFAKLNLQCGKIVENLPTTSFGAAVGTSLGKGNKGKLAVNYEKAVCSCDGENENCFKCDGTRFYTKQIVQETSILPPVPLNSGLRSKNQSPSESSFSNDARGGDYGIRERGRYGSNPLYDDHE